MKLCSTGKTLVAGVEEQSDPKVPTCRAGRLNQAVDFPMHALSCPETAHVTRVMDATNERPCSLQE